MIKAVNVDKVSVNLNQSVRDAIEVLEQEALQIVLVLEMDRLVGVVTDGDIRRGFLLGETIESPIKNLMCKDFYYLSPNSTPDEALALMIEKSLKQVPQLDERGRVTNLFLLENLIIPKTFDTPVVIMAGGRGERLRPMTENCPKPMLTVAGSPMLEIILCQCIENGFRNFYFAVNYLKETIKSHFRDGKKWGANIQYLEEEQALGTAGALSLLPPQSSDTLLIINGDVLTRIDYQNLLRFHLENDAQATLCVRDYSSQIPYGVVKMEDGFVSGIEEKPIINRYVNAGIYCMNKDLLGLIPENTYFDMPQLLEASMAKSHKVRAFPIHEYWLDVGHPETLRQANGDWN